MASKKKATKTTETTVNATEEVPAPFVEIVGTINSMEPHSIHVGPVNDLRKVSLRRMFVRDDTMNLLHSIYVPEDSVVGKMKPGAKVVVRVVPK